MDNLQNLQNLNRITPDNSLVPNYNLDNKEHSLELFISHNKEVCIIGKLDNNYICWCSLTTVEEYDTNSAIFEYLAYHPVKMVSNKYNALGSRYREVESWHRLPITKRKLRNEDFYYSPANSAHFKEGKFFAREIHTFYRQEKLKCEYRLLGQLYVPILQTYKRALMEDGKNASYYLKMKPIIQIIEVEGYLKLCPDPDVRQLYLDCLEAGKSLYNRYMSEVR
ncbi:hypothetical protein J7E71_13245 [Mesobacillus foraminis]|uniref:hypothetical protein n=1 Tax=Mesobacillus foraminis TaxID=279826 RepID=UPI001BE54D92|nr:hypothetical protein [Mesobacillus foraminis]MBT2756909.1 hypothetical protein [Mesobacillus foraminis]